MEAKQTELPPVEVGDGVYLVERGDDQRTVQVKAGEVLSNGLTYTITHYFQAYRIIRRVG